MFRSSQSHVLMRRQGGIAGAGGLLSSAIAGSSGRAAYLGVSSNANVVVVP